MQKPFNKNSDKGFSNPPNQSPGILDDHAVRKVLKVNEIYIDGYNSISGTPKEISFSMEYNTTSGDMDLAISSTIKPTGLNVNGPVICICSSIFDYNLGGEHHLKIEDDGTKGIITQWLDNAEWSYGPITIIATTVTFSGDATTTVVSPYFKISTAPTANGAGVGSIKVRGGVAATNAGWLPIKKSDGTTVYIPYWA
jgi:hypothetical protein